MYTKHVSSNVMVSGIRTMVSILTYKSIGTINQHQENAINIRYAMFTSEVIFVVYLKYVNDVYIDFGVQQYAS